jgi:lipopolysaccharide exporter
MLSTMVLARLLVPADFGLVALATALSGALHAISEFSFDLALIQNQSPARREYDTAWTLSICRNPILAGVLAAGAGLIASAFGDERLEQVVYWLALGTFFSGFQNISVVDFRKQLAFHRG